MLRNQIINVDDDFESGIITEPVTVQQAKDYIRLGGFEDESGEQEFDFDDTKIESMITEGREWVEKYTGQYLVPRQLTVVLLNQAGGLRLPGPVIGSVVYTNPDAEVITDSLTVVGTKYPKITSGWYSFGENAITNNYNPLADQITAVYEVGYTTFPKWVENAILAYVAWAYENRGDEQTGSPERAAAIARPHRRVTAWA